MNLELVMQNSLFYSAVFSLLLSLLILSSMIVNAEMWLGDYPSDIQERYTVSPCLSFPCSTWERGAGHSSVLGAHSTQTVERV